MAKEAFINHRFNRNTTERIALANSILNDLARQGYRISLRQLYYQLVAKGAIPNSQKEYKKLGDTLNKARLAGLVDWSAIEDRGRQLRGWSGGYTGPDDFIRSLEQSYFKDWWDGQDNYVEVWIEKDALIGVIEKPCNRHRVRFFSCRGYSSASEQYDAGKRFARQRAHGRNCYLIHLGDHDPSGLDMTRDNEEKATMFSGVEVTIKRIALNMDQVEELRPPPNPAKMTDSRVGDYIRRFGKKSWELDALPPAYLDRIIDAEIRALIDVARMDEMKAEEAEESEELDKLFDALSGRYDEVTNLLRDGGYL